MATVHREANWGGRSALTRPVHIDDIDAVLNGDECPTIEVVAKLPEARNVTIVAVTADPELRAALAEVIPKQALQFSDSAELVLAGSIPSNCAVLIVEQSLGRATFERLKSHIKQSAPAVVDIVIGTYEDGGSLVRLLAAGQIDRFMVKPLNLGPARTALRSALQQHLSLRSNLKVEQGKGDLRSHLKSQPEPRSDLSPEPTKSKPPTRPDSVAVLSHSESIQVAGSPLKWRLSIVAFAVAAALALVGLGAWFMSTRAPEVADNLVVNKVVADHLATAKRAFELGSYVDPPELSAVHFYNAALELDPSNAQARSGLEAVADRLVEEAKQFIVNGDLLRAQSMVDNVRRMKPNHRELSAVITSLLNARDAERQTIQAALSVAKVTPENSGPVASAPIVRKETAARSANLSAPKKSASVPMNATPARPPISRDVTPQLQESLAVPRSTESNTTQAEESVVSPLPQVAVVAPVTTTEVMARPVAEQPAPKPTPVIPSSSDSAVRTAIPAAAAPSTLATTLANGKLTLIKYVPPVYPSGLRGQKAEGWVDVSFLVTGEGRVIEPQIKNGTLGSKFHRAAFDAVTQWRFSNTSNGNGPNQPVVVHLEFRTPK